MLIFSLNLNQQYLTLKKNIIFSLKIDLSELYLQTQKKADVAQLARAADL